MYRVERLRWNTHNGRKFFLEPPPEPEGEFEFGFLESLHPDETFEEIKARRENNFRIFCEYCDAYKVTGEVLNLPDGERLEMYAEPNQEDDLTDGYINVLNGQVLSVNNESDVVLFPFVLNKKRFNIFNVKYGGTLNFNGDWSGQDIQGKFETYNITFRVGGNLKQLQVNGTVRSGFWDGLTVGDTLMVNYAFETLGAEVTIDSFDPVTGIINTVEDLPGTTNLNNFYTRAGFFFPEDMALDLYQEYGQFWIYDRHRCTFVYSIPPVQVSPPPVTINCTDTSIYGFARQLLLSVANGSINYFGSLCKHERNEIAVNLFSRGTAGYQKYNWQGVTRLRFTDCGTMAGGSITAITAGDILGSGAYVHPNILMRGGSATDPNDLTTGILELHNNTATAFRQYSFGGDNPVILGDPEYRSDFGLIDCIGNIEADIRTSNLIPTRITELRNATSTNNLHYETTINGGELLGQVYANPNESNLQGLFETNIILNNVVINTESRFDVGGNIECNNCDIHVKVPGVEAPAIFTVIDGNPDVRLIGCTFIPDAAISRYTPGSADPVGAVYARDLIFSGNIADPLKCLNEGYIENCNVKDNDFYCGYIISESRDNFPIYANRNRKFIIKDSDLRLSRFSNYTQLRTNFTSQVEVENSLINSPRMVQSTSQRPFIYKPREVVVSKSISSGIIEFNFENEINVTGGGTLHTLSAILYNGATKLDCSMWFSGIVRLNAVGASFDIVDSGNIDTVVTVNDGDYIELNGSRDIIGTLTGTSSLLATSDGTLQSLSNTLATIDINRRYIEITDITSDEVATVDSDGNIVGVNTFGRFDNRTGSYNIEFTNPLANGQTVVVNYSYYSVINYKGVWKG